MLEDKVADDSAGIECVLEARVCQYEASSDGHTFSRIAIRASRMCGSWGGGSGHGFKMGPGLGEHVAALVRGEAEVFPLFAYGRLRPRAE